MAPPPNGRGLQIMGDLEATKEAFFLISLFLLANLFHTASVTARRKSGEIDAAAARPYHVRTI